MQKPFSDLKIIELAGVLAGPAVGTFFAELGAKVIKVESPKGDVTRTWKLEQEVKEKEVSAYFASVNYGKEYLRLDLKNAKDKQALIELIATADIVIANYKKGDDVKLGVDHESLKKINPSIIYASITGYGDDSDRTAFDAVLQAETGFMSMNGTAESGPLKMPVALIDVLAAHQLKEGVLVALLHKYKTGKGSKVSVSLYDAAISSLMNQASNWLMANQNAQLSGSLHPNIAPYGETFLTLDKRHILLAVGNDAQFKHLCKSIDEDSLVENEKYISNQNRVRNRIELAKILQTKISLKNAEEWNSLFSAHAIPFGIIRDMKEVFAAEKTKDLVLEEMIDGVQTKRVKNSIFKISYE